ncbi:MAG TPA: efflux transporter periplasmic adaptor subunit, partial [Thermoanaerobaculia bacterium]|nr:efflux transporter periplasmic adaptor subunit [Thermoanaerobaculia bacterium]
ESYAADVTPGMSARIVYEGSEYAGKVTAVSPEIKDGQVTGTVVFASGKPAGLRQSQRVSVRMVFEEKKDVLKLPRGPFLEGGAGRQAWVVDESGVATRQTIEIGAISVAEVEIAKGLKEGDRVILSDMTAMGSAKTVLLRR